jgi:glyoxylase-like metal-dependent hydrolase (beta-lactamase superfamily II)
MIRISGKRWAGLMAGVMLGMVSMPAMSEYSLDIQKISPNVYALVGELAQRSPENYANNSTHGVIIGDEGVILIDPGGSYRGAQQIHDAIKTLTDKPITYVINTGGQDHRWLGNGYFKQQGAHIITSSAALADHHERAENHLNSLSQFLGDTLDGTVPVYADETFDTEMKLQAGNINLEIYHVGAAHTLGDSFVWFPEQKIMFTGDIVYVERALGTGPAKNVKSWVEVFEKMAAYQPEIVVPGHGHAVEFETAKKDTYDYLVFLIENITRMLDEGVDLQDAVDLDQSQFSYLEVFDEISRKNAQGVYEQLEFDSF